MKYFLVCFMCVFCANFTFGQVRKTKWGMNQREVAASESIKPSLNDDEGLAYVVDLSGYKTFLFYVFNSEGKLSNVSYSLYEKFASENSYLTAYLSLISKLKEKYGEGESDIIWNDDLYRDDKQKWGLAIAAEHLKIKHTWETEDTSIAAEISGKNFKIDVSIRYSSKSIRYNRKTNDLDNF